MTALALADRVAQAARNPFSDIEPAVAVLFELHRRGYWFCRIRERNGITEDIKLPVPRTLGHVEVNAPLPFDEAES
jgi:hypothetical protein